MAEASQSSTSEEEGDFTPILVTGAILMAMGAMYTGQLVHSMSRCCLRRLQAVQNGPGHQAGASRSSSEENILVVSDDELLGAPGQGLGSSTSSNAPVQGRGVTSAGAMSRSMRQQLGSSGAVESNSRRRNVASSSAGSSSNIITGGSGSTPEQGPSTSMSSATPLNSQRQSGLACDAAAAGAASKAAAELAWRLAAVASGNESSSASDAAAERGRAGKKPDDEIQNPWNLLQRQNKGKGWSPTTMARKYRQRSVQKP
eukprot:s2731_g7.t1